MWVTGVMAFINNMVKLINIPEKILIEIVRGSIKTFLDSGKIADFSKLSEVYPGLKKKIGNFVTIYVDKTLRGCIGRIEGSESLFRDLTLNAVDAAFRDIRFTPLVKNELVNLKIEISILAKPKQIYFKKEEEMFKKIFGGESGVIIEYDGRKSIYLPQVWDSYDDPKNYMRDLAAKGGFETGVWRKRDCKIKIFKTQIFEEK